MTTPSPSPSASPFPVRSHRLDVAVMRQQANDDDVVCAFGPDYFRGAALGAGVGSVLAAALCAISFRLLKADQREVDFLAGLRRGERNRHFSPWVVLRGLRTQPMLAVGCLALGATSSMKGIKCYLATSRCREFYQDDMDYAMLQRERMEDPQLDTLLSSIEAEAAAAQKAELPTSPLVSKVAAMAERQRSAAREGANTAASSTSPSTVTGLLNTHDANRGGGAATKLIHRSPSFWDGVAVAFLGSVMDCYLPQKPVQKYYNMHVGMW